MYRVEIATECYQSYDFRTEAKIKMQARSIQITLRINYTAILLAVLSLHALIAFKELKSYKKSIALGDQDSQRQPLNIRSIEKLNVRQVGSPTSKLKEYSSFRKYAPVLNNKITKEPAVKNIKLSDLSAGNPKVQTPKMQRPGTRPMLAMEKTKAINAISLKGKQILEFTKGTNAVALSGDPRANQLSDTDIMVNLEVPEGVEPDELNKYELMFYGFQRRTAINYINSFYKKLDEFQRGNPHLHFPMTENKQVMTGRLTYDEKGNIKQIKMIRWSNEERLQGFFENVLKDMDVLHNPPQALWEKQGEFSIFFSFVVNG